MKTTLSILAAAAVMATIAATAQAQTIVYHDSFARIGTITGTAPDLANTNGNVWLPDSDGNTWISNGSTIESSSFYGGAYLPVNGTSGVTLDGSQDFTLSAYVTGVGNAGIVLAEVPYATGGQFFDSSGQGNTNDGRFLAQIGLLNYAGGRAVGLNANTVVLTTDGLGLSGTVALTYSASAGTISYLFDGTVLGALTGVTAAQIQGLNDVGTGVAAFAGGRVGNFELSVGSAVPEPSTYAMMLGGLGMLLGMRKFRSRKQ